jgi:hypothetical protein
MLHLRVCEVPSASALAFMDYARGALREAVEGPDAIAIAPGVDRMIEDFIDEWEDQARQGPTLSLSIEISAEQLEFLSHAFLQISEWATTRADERGFDVSPPEGDEFYAALSDATIAALEFSGNDSSTEFASVLRQNWPRVDRLGSTDGSMGPGDGAADHDSEQAP